MLRTRIIVALVFLPVFVWLIYLPTPIPLFGLVLAGLVLATLEFGRMVMQRLIPFRWWIVVPTILFMSLVPMGLKPQADLWPMNVFALCWLISLAAVLILGLLELLKGYSETKSFATLGASTLCVLALGGIGTFLILLRLLPQGSHWWVLLFGFNWIYDAAALFAGKAFGRTALAPTISPSKTVEGMVGGLCMNAVTAGVVYWLWFPASMGFSLWGFVLLGVSMGVLAQAGDLIESMLKRWSGSKDASHIIPGHGGILDKIDNLCFTAPLLFGVAWWLMHP